jgi:basic membrane protein A
MKSVFLTMALFVGMAFTVGVLLISCAKNDTNGEDYGNMIPLGERQQLEPPENGHVTIAVITNQSSIANDSVSEACWEGIREAAETSPNVKVTLIEGIGVSELPAQIAALAETGVNVIWSANSALAADMRVVAPAYPEIQFVATDAYYPGDPLNPVALYYPNDAYSSFLAGYIAAKISKSGIIGFIGAYESSGVDVEFYKSGAYYACGDIGILDEYFDRSFDTFAEIGRVEETAENMYLQGADVILHSVGPAGCGVISAALKHDGYVIGSDVDQTSLAPENIIASLDKNIKTSVRKAVMLYLSGRRIHEAIVFSPLADDGSHLALNDNILPESLLNEVGKISDRIKSGELKYGDLISAYRRHERQSDHG